MTCSFASMARVAWPDRVGPLAGTLGAVVIGLVSLVAGAAHSGPLGEGYSPLNHWVSELGKTGVSSLAAVFNLGLIVGGVSFATFMAALSAVRPGRLAAVFGAVGMASGVFGALVGAFPLGQSDLHVVVAAGYFSLGGLAVALASLDIARRPSPAFPAWLAAVGGVVAAFFLGFIVAAAASGRADASGARPSLLIEPTLEWAAVIGMLVWTVLVAATWRRGAANSTR